MMCVFPSPNKIHNINGLRQKLCFKQGKGSYELLSRGLAASKPCQLWSHRTNSDIQHLNFIFFGPSLLSKQALEKLSACWTPHWSSTMWEREMCHPTLCGGSWVAFERQKVLTGRNKFMSSHKRFSTATVDSEKSGWREIKQLKCI